MCVLCTITAVYYFSFFYEFGNAYLPLPELLHLVLHLYCLFVDCVGQNTMDTNDAEEADGNVAVRDVSENEPLLGDDYSVTHVVPKVSFSSCRLVLIFMGFLGFLNIYCLRVNLSIALVAMLNHTRQPLANVSWNYSEKNVCQSCRSIGANEFEKDDTRGGELNWDSPTQGTVLAAFFYGYMMTQV